MIPRTIASLLENRGIADLGTLRALSAIIYTADERGHSTWTAAATRYREDFLNELRREGRDADREAGRLSLDEVREHLVSGPLPRLAETGLLDLGDGRFLDPNAPIVIRPDMWATIVADRAEVEFALRGTGIMQAVAPAPQSQVVLESPSRLEASGLTKVYRRRTVVNDVGLHLTQGEIVGLLGPNGAGKTTTFYMIVGLIPPRSGTIALDGRDITSMPMYKRARLGIGYLSQEPSVFRKLTVEENLLAILETLPLTRAAREQRLESLLDELSIKHLRSSKAYALSGGERRRLEITRALVTEPKFMMLDEPFAGVDPIAVHDIQSIVAGLKHRGIGVLISDHNVEQTLDIVDRAYIMFDGQVKVSGTVRELVFDDTVAEIYLGPTLTARLRERFATERVPAPPVTTASVVEAVPFERPSIPVVMSAEDAAPERPPEASV
jgi:lipopolysaccharide export system ATP-binding protein